MKTSHYRKTGRSIYLVSLAALGLTLTALSGWQLAQEGFGLPWLLLTALAAVSANASLKIPGIDSRISVADTFVLTSMIFLGPAAGCLSAAAEALCGSLRCKTKSKRLQFALFNVGSLTTSAYLAGHLFFLILDSGPLCLGPGGSLTNLFPAAVILALSYYFLNSGSVALMVALDTGTNPYRMWRDNFLWQVVGYLSATFSALLICLNSSLLIPSVLISISLVVVILYAAYRNLLARLATHPQAQK